MIHLEIKPLAFGNIFWLVIATLLDVCKFGRLDVFLMLAEDLLALDGLAAFEGLDLNLLKSNSLQ